MNPKEKDARGKKSEQPGNRKQQEAASGAGQQYGEGNYAATRQYNEGLKDHVENHDIEREARDAAPKSEAEAREMEDAERIGRSRARSSGTEEPDDPNDPESERNVGK